ncbi:hypothetical protein SNEBB_000871 [Seison nebaliae]|nr:hypothetical protein SNEBB_000871 [Seison nebaliae]
MSDKSLASDKLKHRHVALSFTDNDTKIKVVENKGRRRGTILSHLTPKPSKKKNVQAIPLPLTSSAPSRHLLRNRLHSLDLHIPPLFCQLNEFCTINLREEINQNSVWREAARWVRFEEKALKSPGRWSKPRVATLTMTSLTDLRSIIRERGILMFHETSSIKNLDDLAESVSQKLHTKLQFDHKTCNNIKRIINMPIVHNHQIKGTDGKISRVRDVTKKLHLDEIYSRSEYSTDSDRNNNGNNGGGAEGNKLISGLPRFRKTSITSGNSDSSKDVMKGKKKKKSNYRFKKKIGEGCLGAAISVASLDCINEILVVIIRLEESIEVPNLFEVDIPCKFFCCIFGPANKPTDHYRVYEMGRCLATALIDDVYKEIAYSCENRSEFIQMFDYFMFDAMVIPPSEWNPLLDIEPPEKILTKENRKQMPNIDYIIHKSNIDELHTHGDEIEKTGRIFGGLIGDVKRKMKWYASDFRDALSLQCVAAAVFLYLVTLCSVVAFGALIGGATRNKMATMECIISGSVVGVLFSLFAGQPMNILSATGPILIMEEIVFQLCERFGFEFLEFRLWIGIWVSVILLFFVMFDLSFLVKFITRFTEECFASLVSIIFIYEAIKQLFSILKTDPIATNTIHKEHLEAALEVDHLKCICDLRVNTSLLPYYKQKHLEHYFIDDDELVGNVTDSVVDESLIANMNISSPGDYLSHFNPPTLADCSSKGGILTGYPQWACDQLIEHAQYHPDVFFWCTIMFIITFTLCIKLKKFKTSHYLPSVVRNFISDFSVLFAIVICTVIDFLLALKTPKLVVPNEFRPTRNDREWFIHPMKHNKFWTIFAAFIPACLATLLIFMDQQITAVIINRKEFKLKKGVGYHLDLLIIAISVALCSLFGLPWFVAATVLAVTHVQALKIESACTAPGEKPQFLGIREQRVTNLLMSILMGVSVFFTSFLNFIPMPALYGIFLFMGINTLNGIQFIDRIKLLFMPSKYQPEYDYLQHVKLSRIHFFTLWQILALIALLVVKKVHVIAITFPLLVVGTCFLRRFLEKFFNDYELYWLDDILPGSKFDPKTFEKQIDQELQHLVSPAAKNEKNSAQCL